MLTKHTMDYLLCLQVEMVFYLFLTHHKLVLESYLSLATIITNGLSLMTKTNCVDSFLTWWTCAAFITRVFNEKQNYPEYYHHYNLLQNCHFYFFSLLT